MDELPASWVYLAHRLGRMVDDETLTAAHDADRARQLVRLSRKALDTSPPALALRLVAQQRLDTTARSNVADTSSPGQLSTVAR